MKDKKHLLVLLVPVAIILISGIFLIRHYLTPERQVFTGVFETKVVHVASELPGRIDRILVDRGMNVKRNDTLYTLQRQILDTKVGQAEGLLKAAKSQQKKIEKGSREEIIRSAKSQYDLAKSNYSYAVKTYKRYRTLFADSIVSKQEMEAIQLQMEASENALKAAKAHYDLVVHGARDEDIEGARAAVQQAQSVYEEALVFYEELVVRSPIDGEVANILAEEGEVMPPGYPVVSVMSPEHIHAILNVREDYLPLFEKGKKLKGTVAGLGYETYEFEVTFISPMADFATWVPTNVKGEFDLKSFEIHLKPVVFIENLRPGMTVQFEF